MKNETRELTRPTLDELGDLLVQAMFANVEKKILYKYKKKVHWRRITKEELISIETRHSIQATA